jgi:hypothetical protein
MRGIVGLHLRNAAFAPRPDRRSWTTARSRTAPPCDDGGSGVTTRAHTPPARFFGDRVAERLTTADRIFFRYVRPGDNEE